MQFEAPNPAAAAKKLRGASNASLNGMASLAAKAKPGNAAPKANMPPQLAPLKNKPSAPPLEMEPLAEDGAAGARRPACSAAN